MGNPNPANSSAAIPTAKWGLIAGNGRFPFLVLEGARSQGIEMSVIALREEASPELERRRNGCTGWAWANLAARLICCIRKA